MDQDWARLKPGAWNSSFHLGHFLLLSHAQYQGAALGIKKQELNQMHKCDSRAAEGSFTHYAPSRPLNSTFFLIHTLESNGAGSGTLVPPHQLGDTNWFSGCWIQPVSVTGIAKQLESKPEEWSALSLSVSLYLLLPLYLSNMCVYCIRSNILCK